MVRRRSGQEASAIDTVRSELPRLYRSQRERLVAGVGAGIAAHLGVPAITVRIVFVAQDRGTASTVEAAVDDVRITQP